MRVPTNYYVPSITLISFYDIRRDLLPEEIDKLQKLLPKCKINHEFGKDRFPILSHALRHVD